MNQALLAELQRLRAYPSVTVLAGADALAEDPDEPE